MPHNVLGLLLAVEFKKVSGRALQQIHFYLWARPVVWRLAANRLLALGLFQNFDF